MSERTAYKEPDKLWNSAFILLLLLNTFYQGATQMITPLITKYVMTFDNVPLTIAGTIAGLYSVSALILRPVSGMCSDRYNRKNIIRFTMIATGLVIFAYSLVNSVAGVAAVRTFHGVFFSFSSVAMMSLITMYIPSDKIGEGIGWMGLSNIASQALGPAVGARLVESFSYQTCFRVAALVNIAGIFVTYIIPDVNTVVPEGKPRIKLENLISVRILPYACIMALFSCGNGLINAFLLLVGEERGIANVSLFFTVYSIAMVCTRPFVGKLLDKKGIKFVLYPAIVIASCGMFLLSGAKAFIPLMIAGIMKALGQGSGSPSIQATCIKQLGKEKSGVVSSTCYIGQDVGNALAPSLGGMVADNYGYGIMFAGYASLLLVGSSLIFFFKSRYDEKKYGKTV